MGGTAFSTALDRSLRIVSIVDDRDGLGVITGEFFFVILGGCCCEFALFVDEELLSESDVSVSGVFGMHGWLEKDRGRRRNFSAGDFFFVV
jgi:hypothetical protein